MKYFFSAIAAVPLVLLADYAKANDDALYGQATPEDAVFVRFLGDPSNADLVVHGRQFDGDAADASYTIISEALLPEAPVSRFNTAIVGEDGVEIVIAEPARNSTSKVHLLLLNAVDQNVRLLANGGALEVIGSTEFGTAEMRAVNPITIDLSVVQGPNMEVLAEFEVALKRGEDLSFVVTEAGVEVIPTSYGTVIAD